MIFNRFLEEHKSKVSKFFVADGAARLSMMLNVNVNQCRGEII